MLNEIALIVVRVFIFLIAFLTTVYFLTKQIKLKSYYKNSVPVIKHVNTIYYLQNEKNNVEIQEEIFELLYNLFTDAEIQNIKLDEKTVFLVPSFWNKETVLNSEVSMLFTEMINNKLDEFETIMNSSVKKLAIIVKYSTEENVQELQKVYEDVLKDRKEIWFHKKKLEKFLGALTGGI